MIVDILGKKMLDLEYGSYLKILTPKQILQRLSITLAQVKAVNIFENLLDYISVRAKEITKKVYNNIMNSIKL